MKKISRLPTGKLSSSVARRYKLQGYRSQFEMDIAVQLNSSKVRWEYESERISYQPKKATYVTDFILKGQACRIYIETKGWFKGKDRTKHLLLKQQYPNLDIRFVFMNSKAKLYKGSNTNYGQWCKKHGFSFSQGSIPESWIRECMGKG